ncbi:NADH dehydrogenase [ubiquinone] 1 beta subcomplex subunit 8, mitochondrial-like [Physella acuta]|uniref:NADH dehydrogenase [ubiquinone] 1 beta subcomplex subunit 8, mitochondrial-like n=1 Tax=Physella acuta TaxID=109671 RepID=UPI0027DB16F5|nr:NADH dehydrogenase [ubiquinone] 1 beta subcomplex subunit 8, mitochondrial-like [Physella acuta]
MATLRKCLSLLTRQTRLQISQQKADLTTTPVLAAAYWNKDWKPGPLPRTPEERAAAAKKFGLRPEDYNVLADGDLEEYPHLPAVSSQWRDPFEDYEFAADRRNYGEPVHADRDIVGLDQLDRNDHGRYSYGEVFVRFLAIFAGFVAAHTLLEPYPYFLPQMPKQYPFNNLYLERGGDPSLEPEVKHYSFEPAD